MFFDHMQLLKKTVAIETTVVSDSNLLIKNMKEKKIGFHIFFFSFLCSAIPYLDLGILKMLIRVCFRDVLQPGAY